MLPFVIWLYSLFHVCGGRKEVENANLLNEENVREQSISATRDVGRVQLAVGRVVVSQAAAPGSLHNDLTATSGDARNVLQDRNWCSTGQRPPGGARLVRGCPGPLTGRCWCCQTGQGLSWSQGNKGGVGLVLTQPGLPQAS